MLLVAGEGRGKSLERNEGGAPYSTAEHDTLKRGYGTRLYIYTHCTHTDLSELERSQDRLERNWARRGSGRG